jgi:hypothetical protein
MKSGSSDSSPDNKPYISKHDVGISSSYNVIRLFVALVQLYSVINLLRANKLEDYSAYQLTLVPYALMSFINIVSGFVTPSYTAVYMVRSSVMEEAERRGAVFEGWVGELDEQPRLLDGLIAEKGQEQSSDSERQIRRKISPEKKDKPIICFGMFCDAGKGVLRLKTYFYHLGMSLPLVRLILQRHFKNVMASSKSSSLSVFNAVFNKAEKKTEKKAEDKIEVNAKDKASIPEKYYYVLQIGNVNHQQAATQRMKYIMDLVMIGGLAAPWVTIYYLTGFRSPKQGVAGFFFMLWLTVGQFLPFILLPSWSLINLKIWRVKMLRAILVSFLCVFLFSVFAVGGFYFVGELRYQELTKNQNNCSKSQSRINLILMCSRLIININSCCKQSPRQRIVKWSLHSQLASGGKSITFLIEITHCLNVVQMIRIRQCERKRNLWNWIHEKALLVDLHRARRIYS